MKETRKLRTKKKYIVHLCIDMKGKQKKFMPIWRKRDEYKKKEIVKVKKIKWTCIWSKTRRWWGQNIMAVCRDEKLCIKTDKTKKKWEKIKSRATFNNGGVGRHE